MQVGRQLDVREDAQVLFGFGSEQEKSMFQNLISVNGIGPNTAMVVLSYMPPAELRSAIIREDAVTLQSIKGIGGKTAQRLILELKDKLKKDAGEEITTGLAPSYNKMKQEALTALMTLGIARSAAEKSLDTVLKKSGNSLTLEDLVKQALKNA
jgi:Holliday junction DNA helicase RuvA